MSDQSKIFDNLPETFDDFFEKLLVELELEDFNDEQLVEFEAQVLTMFNNAVIEAAVKSLNDEDKDFIDGYMILHPEASEIDVYLAVASEKPGVKALLDEVLEKTFQKIVYLKEQLKDV